MESEKYTGIIITEETERLYERVRTIQCKEMQISTDTFNRICGVISLGWCYTVVNEKVWVLARLKYGI